MIKWYDVLAAFIAADIMATAFFSLPIIGAFVAYGVYELWNQVYCNWRLDQEHG